jgi:hypothetical protein
MRRTHFTVMLVCEGNAEDEFARVVRDLFLERNCGTVMQRRIAGGYGAARALQLAIELKQEDAFDAYGILIDTDRHWTAEDQARAAAMGIKAIENSPCIEATLLSMDGQKTYRSTHDNKAAFEERYGGPAHRSGIIRRHFPRETFEAARGRLLAIDTLLRLIAPRRPG